MLKNIFFGFFKTLKSYKIIIANFGYLSFLQVFTTVVPLLIYPFLAKVLGSDLYGKVIFAHSVIAIISVFIDYGFNISAVKEVAEYKDNSKKLTEIVSSVLQIKLYIWLLSLVVLVLIILFIPRFQSDPKLFLFSFMITFNQLLFPVWFFQGIEKMKYITIIDITSKLAFLVLIFVLVSKPEDYLLVPLLQGIGVFMGGLVSFYLVFRIEKVKFQFQNKITLKKYLLSGSSMFGFRLSGVLKTQTNQIILGLMSNYSMVTFYDLAIKITSIFTIVFNNYTSVFLPHIARSKDIRIGKKALKISFLLSFAAYILSAISLKPIIITWNAEFIETVKLYWIVGLFIPIYAVASFLGNTILVAHGFQKQHFYSTAWTTILYVVVIFILIYLRLINIYSLGITIVLIQLLSTLHKVYYGRKYNLI